MPLLISAAAGQTLSVPVTFKSNGSAVNNLSFAVEFDPARLSLDPAGIRFNLPGSFTGETVNPDLANGKFGVIILGPASGACPMAIC
jgi:hypothetical protein